MTSAHNPQFQASTPPGLLARLLALILSAAFMVFAFMFSLVAVAIVAVIGIVLGGWLWWKTRRLRQQLREAQIKAGTAAAPGEQIIEGEFSRETPPDQHLG